MQRTTKARLLGAVIGLVICAIIVYAAHADKHLDIPSTTTSLFSTDLSDQPLNGYPGFTVLSVEGITFSTLKSVTVARTGDRNVYQCFVSQNMGVKIGDSVNLLMARGVIQPSQLNGDRIATVTFTHLNK